MYKEILEEADEQKRIQIVKDMQTIIADEVGWIPTNVGTMGAAWRPDKVTNVTSGATQYSYPWTYKVSPA
jgi:ABC-type transport system substrate-binding protein